MIVKPKGKLNGLFFTDLHLFPHGGRFSRVDDGMEALRWVEEQYIKLGCNHLFFLGDWSHDKHRTHNIVISRTQEILTRWRDELGIRMTFIPGNHDCPYITDPRDALSYLNPYGQVHRQPFAYFYEDVEILCVPWSGPHDRTWNVIQAAAKSLREHPQHDPMRRTLFLGHLDLVGASMTNTSRSKTGLDSLNISQLFDLTLLGHYHVFDMFTPQVWYVGSLLSTRFDEEGTRGVVHYTGGGAELIPNQVSPMHLKLFPEDLTPEVCKNNYVRVLTNPTDDSAELRHKVMEFGARTARLVPDPSVAADADEEGVTLDKSACQLSDEDIFGKWVDEAAPDGLNKETLKDEGSRIIRLAREI